MNESLEPRVARRQLAKSLDTLSLLDMSLRGARELGVDSTKIEDQIDLLQGKIPYLRFKANAPIQHRRRPLLSNPTTARNRPVFDVFLDESGHRHRHSSKNFGIFVVAAAVVEHDLFENTVLPAAQALKRQFFGDDDVVFHEPDLRDHNGAFYFDGDTETQLRFDSAYESFLASSNVRVIGAVLDKAEIARRYGDAAIDDYLPDSYYALAYHFVLERLCNFLFYEAGDSQGVLYPECIGHKEDAELQLEHARLMNYGTRFVSEKWLRYQIAPGLRFAHKGENFGLELADTAARTIAEHFLQGPGVARWATIEPILYCGHMDRDEKDGCYKVFPTTIE